jgi:hypothetical protein
VCACPGIFEFKTIGLCLLASAVVFNSGLALLTVGNGGKGMQ